MESLPILYQGMPVGELRAEQFSEETAFSACCHVPEEGLQCLWVVGSAGELRLGVPEGRAFSRRYSRRMTAPLGRLLRGELRKVGAGREEWQSVSHPEELFRTPWLRRALNGAEGILVKQRGRCLALPYSPDRPFLLTPLFCFCRIRRIGQREYAVFRFDDAEWPQLP